MLLRTAGRGTKLQGPRKSQKPSTRYRDIVIQYRETHRILQPHTAVCDAWGFKGTQASRSAQKLRGDRHRESRPYLLHARDKTSAAKHAQNVNASGSS